MRTLMSTRFARYPMLPALILALCVLAVPASAQEAAAPADEAAGDLEPIKIELPQPAYGGTPLAYYGPNLEPASFKPRPPFLAPKGTSLVSKDAKVTSSSPPQVGELAMLVDGDKEAYEKAVVELPSDQQWVQLDLGKEFDIYAIVVWHFFAYDRVYFDVIVQVSNDPEFQEGVTTLFNNDHDNTSGLGAGTDKEYIEKHEGRLIDAEGVTARYVRLYSKGNTTDGANHYIEVEVYGKPAA